MLEAIGRRVQRLVRTNFAGLVLEGLVDPTDIARIDAELAPSVNARRPGFIGELDEGIPDTL